jgi:hypothetical protein
MKIKWKGSWGIIFANKSGTSEWELKLCHYKFLSAYDNYQYEWHKITDKQYQAILSGEEIIEKVWSEVKSL